MRIAPADNSYLTFSHMVAGYRILSSVLHAVYLGIIEAVGADGCTIEEILKASGIRREEGERFLSLLTSLGVLEKYGDRFFLSQFSRRYLFQGSAQSQLQVLRFETVLMEKWAQLDTVLRQGQGSLQSELPDEEYHERLLLFHSAMHEAAVVRSDELWEALTFLPAKGTIIDVGAGDGTYLKSFLRVHPDWVGVACDLGDVLELGEGNFQGSAVTPHPLNLLDEGDTAGLVKAYQGQASLLLFSNVLHCYGDHDNALILNRLKELVSEDGIVVVHDFFTDANPFGALYDGHMLVNTYGGRTCTIDEAKALLALNGFPHTCEFLLPSASCALVASSKPLQGWESDLLSELKREALALGFHEARGVAVDKIRIEPWVKAKCRYGCSLFGKKWSCPPHSLDAAEFRELLGCYGKALLVVGQPPLVSFQEQLLELEKRAFLKGMKKALVFSGGPCAFCDSCPEDRCRFPEKRRPSLESCGCDVFDLAKSCGIEMQPIKNSDDFVQYVGLLLID